MHKFFKIILLLLGTNVSLLRADFGQRWGKGNVYFLKQIPICVFSISGYFIFQAEA